MRLTHTQSNTPTRAMMGALIVALTMVGCASKPANQGKSPTKITNLNGVPSHYQVKKGDTVSKIAARYGLNWREVSAMNRLDSNHTIHVGQWLTLHNGTKNSNQSSSRPTVVRQTTSTPTPNYTYNNGQLPTATITAQPVSIGSSLLSFSYPVSKSNPVARRFGTPTSTGMTEGMFFSGKDGDSILSAGVGSVIHADTNIATQDRPVVMIQHANGYVSSYFDVKNIQVRTGQSVAAGQTLGNMMAQTQSGLALFEFRIAKNGSYIDPVSVLH
ncbi:MAG: M23 family metallopeptidase [Moraxella sp.]|nr:M23 family metallopeptidase [Moraxella sp.]